MKQIILILIIVLCPVTKAYSLDPCDRQTRYVPIAERYKKGVFFVVKKCGVQPNYLLGTMHSDDPRVTDMLGNVFAKLAYVSAAAFEIKFDPSTIKTVMEGMYFQPDSIETLQSAVGISAYNDYVQLMKRIQPENPESAYYRLRPWAAAVMLQEPPNTSGEVALDLKLQNFASSRGITVYGLETAESQLKIFEDVPIAKQIEFFKDAVNNYAQIEKDNKELMALYLAQDLNKLQELGDRSFDTISDREFASKLKLEMVDKRNRKMIAAMSELLDRGNAFIAVGALHLTDKEGILRQLEDRGYYIEVVADSDGMGN